jgi:hypothetical protein
MAGRDVPRGPGRGKGRGADTGRDPAAYYVTSESDRRYAAEARRRLRQMRNRIWVTRLLVLAVLGVLAWMLGPDLWSLVRAKAGATAEELQQTGDHIRAGAERRSGADLVEESP